MSRTVSVKFRLRVKVYLHVTFLARFRVKVEHGADGNSLNNGQNG